MTELRRTLRTPKGLLALVFLALWTAAAAGTGWSAALTSLGWAIAGAAAVEVLAGRAGGGNWRWPSSALLSGAIVAFVLGVETPGLVVATVGALASASKYLLATRRGHVFNPAGLALLAAVPLFATGQSWWGALADRPGLWALLLVAAGALVVERVNKFPLALTFLGTLFGLFALIGLAEPARVAEMFRPPFVQSALFLASFMLTDPPTSPGKAADQVWMGALAGAVAVAAQLAGAGQAYLLLGLLAVNVALAVQRWAQGRAQRTQRVPGAAEPVAGPGRSDDRAAGAGPLLARIS